MTTAILIPGLISDARVWRPVAAVLDSHVLVHHADLTQMTGITQAAEELQAKVEGPLLLAGHSMGGRIALEMARLAPDRVQGMILANTGHGPRREGEEVKRQQMIDLGYRSMEELVDTWLPPMVDVARQDDAELMADLREMALLADAEQHERQIRALMDRPNASAYLDAIKCPVLLIVGRQDRWSPIAQHEEIAAAVADAELAIIEHAGHFAPVERPEDVVSVARDWLSRKVLS